MSYNGRNVGMMSGGRMPGGTMNGGMNGGFNIGNSGTNTPFNPGPPALQPTREELAMLHQQRQRVRQRQQQLQLQHQQPQMQRKQQYQRQPNGMNTSTQQPNNFFSNGTQYSNGNGHQNGGNNQQHGNQYLLSNSNTQYSNGGILTHGGGGGGNGKNLMIQNPQPLPTQNHQPPMHTTGTGTRISTLIITTGPAKIVQHYLDGYNSGSRYKWIRDYRSLSMDAKEFVDGVSHMTYFQKMMIKHHADGRMELDHYLMSACVTLAHRMPVNNFFLMNGIPLTKLAGNTLPLMSDEISRTGDPFYAIFFVHEVNAMLLEKYTPREMFQYVQYVKAIRRTKFKPMIPTVSALAKKTVDDIIKKLTATKKVSFDELPATKKLLLAKSQIEAQMRALKESNDLLESNNKEMKSQLAMLTKENTALLRRREKLKKSRDKWETKYTNLQDQMDMADFMPGFDICFRPNEPYRPERIDGNYENQIAHATSNTIEDFDDGTASSKMRVALLRKLINWGTFSIDQRDLPDGLGIKPDEIFDFNYFRNCDPENAGDIKIFDYILNNQCSMTQLMDRATLGTKTVKLRCAGKKKLQLLHAVIDHIRTLLVVDQETRLMDEEAFPNHQALWGNKFGRDEDEDEDDEEEESSDDDEDL